MLPDFKTLIKEIKSKRKDLGWSQKKLSNRAGVSQSLVAKLEQEMNVPNYESVRKVYETLERNLSSDLETADDLVNPEIVSVRPDDTRGEAVKIMKENDFSQLPVKEGEDYVGIVLSTDLGTEKDETPIEEVMRHSLPISPAQQSKTSCSRTPKDTQRDSGGR